MKNKKKFYLMLLIKMKLNNKEITNKILIIKMCHKLIKKLIKGEIILNLKEAK